MRKIFFLLLSVVAATTAWAQTTFTAGDLTYTVTDADAKTVSVKQANSQVGGALVIPTTVENDGVSYSVTSIAESGFKYNANITSVVFPASMRSTGESCFEECKNIASITLNEGLETIGDYLLWMRSGESSNAKLTTVTIPSTVTSIGRGAFYNCTALAEITFRGAEEPITLNHANYAVFENCPATTVNLDRNIEGSTRADFPTVQTLVVGGNVTKLHENMFKDCKQLTSVTLGSNLTEVGKQCFYGCSALTGIDIPESIATLSESMFEECTRLASVTLHEGLTTVDQWAFYKCALTSVILPASVTSVGKNVFYGCPIEEFHISDSETELSVDAAANIPGKNFYIGRNLTFAEGTSMFNDVETLTLGGNMTTIPESLARGKSTLKTLVVGESIVNIAGATAFRETGLTSVSLPSTLKVLPQETFEKCYSLTTVTLAEGLEEIGHGAFYDCKALTEITLPASLKKIGKGVFHRNEALKKMVVTDSDIELSFETSGYGYGTLNMTPDYTLDHIYVGRNIVRNDEHTNSIIAQAKVVELGEKVTSLGYLMSTTSDVSDIYVPWITPIKQTEDICNGNYSNITLWIPDGTKEAYQTEDIWKKFTTMNYHSTLVTLTALTHGRATFSCNRDLDFSKVSGLAAYIASGFDRDNGTVLLSKVDVVPAYTGLFLVGTAGTTYKVPYATATSYYVNMLKPVVTPKVVPATEEGYINFFYGEYNGIAGFYKASGTGEVAAKKAYLQVSTSMAGAMAKSCLMVRFTDDEVTGIDRTRVDNVTGKAIYDLNGRKVADRLEGAHLPSGIYIVKGKKVYVK